MENDKLNKNQFLLYKNDSGSIKIDVVLQDETVHLTQNRMTQLFGVETNTINYHLKEIYKSHELSKSSTIQQIRIVPKEGSINFERTQQLYNLDVIISV